MFDIIVIGALMGDINGDNTISVADVTGIVSLVLDL